MKIFCLIKTFKRLIGKCLEHKLYEIAQEKPQNLLKNYIRKFVKIFYENIFKIYIYENILPYKNL